MVEEGRWVGNGGKGIEVKRKSVAGAPQRTTTELWETKRKNIDLMFNALSA